MSKFQEIISAAQFKISGGSEYLWSCYGPHARYLDFTSDEFDFDMSLVFDSVNQEVYESSLYINGSAFRWQNPEFITQYKQECFARDIDPRVAYEGTFYSNCEVFEDYIQKVTDSFTSGDCDHDIVMRFDFTPEQMEIFEQLPENTNMEEFLIQVIAEQVERVSQQNRENWDVVFSSLAQSGIKVTIDNDISPISESNIQEIYDWISSLHLKSVDLVYSDKENSQGIQSTISLIDNSDISFSYYFK